MQFKYPELLWALFLLLIPILIHLFQLRRFKKTPFTNVKLLQKVVANSRRSNTLKKWLLLFTRLSLLVMLITAFAQPFFAEVSALKEKETVIYLDNSFSMEAKANGNSLLGTAVQELIKSIPKEAHFSLFTNTQTFRDVTIKDVQNTLIALPPTQKQLKLEGVYLKSKALFSDRKNSLRNLIIISDFQQSMYSKHLDSLNGIQKHLVQMVPEDSHNIAIDSAYVTNTTVENSDLAVLFSANQNTENIPVSLFNNNKLIAKTAASFGGKKNAKVSFSIPNNEIINGKIEIADTSLPYDNHYYFNIDLKRKIKVLVITEGDSNYLNRIFTKDEFQLSTCTTKTLNYTQLEAQDMIVLNELGTLPNALQNTLTSFTDKGGSLVIVPAREINLNSYNQLLANYFSTRYSQQIKTGRKVVNIAFQHPLYKNVFERKVTNFQYPDVAEHYSLRSTAPKILSFEDHSPFLVGAKGIYIFTAALNAKNSNFKNSPLIVPTFYAMGLNSLKQPKLYSLLAQTTEVDIPMSLSKDNILKVVQADYGFIPRQQSYANKVTLFFNENPQRDGIYEIKEGDSTIKNISFNYPRTESKLEYLQLNNLAATTKQGSIANLFETIEKNNSITELWKWFVILALLFLAIEALIQKYYK